MSHAIIVKSVSTVRVFLTASPFQRREASQVRLCTLLHAVADVDFFLTARNRRLK